MEDVFFGTRTVAEVTYSVDSAEVTCRTDERWKTLHVMTSACGGSVEYTVTKRSGLTQTDSETLSASLSSSIGFPKLAELKSAVETKLGMEVKWEAALETQHKHVVQAPPCGRRTDSVYQLFRDHQFLLVRKGWFGRTHKRAWSVSEAISHYHVQPEIDVWIPECQCPKKVEGPRFDILPAVLQIGGVSLGLELWRASSGVRLNFAGRLAALDSMPDKPVRLDLPRAILMPVVPWLAESVGDPIKVLLYPNHEWLGRQDTVPVMFDRLETISAHVGEAKEEDGEEGFEYEQR